MTSTAVPPAGDAVVVTEATRVAFHPLSTRYDSGSWVIGRIDTGDFAVMPPVAHRAIALLREGRTVGEVTQVLRQETGKVMAVADFVGSLDGMGFLTAIDGQARAGPCPVRPSLPWLRQRHLRWLLHPALPWLVLTIIAAATAMVISRSVPLPRYQDLVWSRHAGLVLAGNACIAWILLFLHELGHLTTARAAGIPARLSISTRLQFLVAQTDVSGIWAAPRRTRLTVYLAGIAVHLAAAAVFILIIGLARPHGLAHHLLAAATLTALLALPMELLVFMRTDVYFLLQDLAGCANLYADGSARIRYLTQRLRHALDHAGATPRDPAKDLPPRERRAVQAYSWVLLCGTISGIAAAALFAVPAAITLLAHAITEISRASPAAKSDGIAAIAVCCGFQILWLRTWWRRHGHRVRDYRQTRKQRNPIGGEERGARQHQQAGQARDASSVRADQHPQTRQDRDHRPAEQ